MAVEVFRKLIGGVWRTVVEDPGGNGGYVPVRSVGQVLLNTEDIVVPGPGQTTIPWEFAQGDAAMIDLSVPTLPAPIAAGTYAYALQVTQNGGGDGSPFYAFLTVDEDFYTTTVSDSALGLANPDYAQTQALVTLTWFGTARSAFLAIIGNVGVAGSDHFTAQLAIQRIT